MGAFRREEKTCFQWPETVPQGPGRRRPARAPAPLRAQLTSPARGHTSRAGAVSGISPHSEHPVRTKPIPGLSRRGGWCSELPHLLGSFLASLAPTMPPCHPAGRFQKPCACCRAALAPERGARPPLTAHPSSAVTCLHFLAGGHKGLGITDQSKLNATSHHSLLLQFG